MKIKIMALWRKPKEKFMEMVLLGIVEELLGADLMEHNILHKVLTFWTQTNMFNILQQLAKVLLFEPKQMYSKSYNMLHKGIGVTETLETLARSSFSHTVHFNNCILHRSNGTEGCA